MTKRKPLQWTDEGDDKLGYPTCIECFEKMREPGLVEACASVGIERGKSTGLMLKEYLDHYHAQRHEDPV
jgi:hypothetical protein